MGSMEMRVDRQGVFTDWGSGLERIFGWTAADVIGESAGMIIPPVVHKLHWKGFGKAVAAGRLKRERKVHYAVVVHKDGHRVPIRSFDILEFADDGSCCGVRVVVLRRGLRSWLRRVDYPAV